MLHGRLWVVLTVRSSSFRFSQGRGATGRGPGGTHELNSLSAVPRGWLWHQNVPCIRIAPAAWCPFLIGRVVVLLQGTTHANKGATYAAVFSSLLAHQSRRAANEVSHQCSCQLVCLHAVDCTARVTDRLTNRLQKQPYSNAITSTEGIDFYSTAPLWAFPTRRIGRPSIGGRLYAFIVRGQGGMCSVGAMSVPSLTYQPDLPALTLLPVQDRHPVDDTCGGGGSGVTSTGTRTRRFRHSPTELFFVTTTIATT